MKYVNGNVFFKEKNKEVYPYLNKNIYSNICIIGGGLSGIILAYFLAKQEKDVIICEKNIIGYGQSLGNDGVLRIDYNTLSNLRKKEDILRLLTLYKVSIEKLIEILDEIGCKYSKIDTYSYTSKIMQKGNMQKNIYLFSQLFEIDGELTDKIDGIDTTLNIKWNDKALTFNPNEFINKLAKYITENMNIKIYENTEIVDVQPEYDRVILTTDNDFIIHSNKVIYCTGLDTLNIVNINVSTYEKYTVVTEPKKEIENAPKVLYNFNEEESMIYLMNEGNIAITGEETKVNSRYLDEKYRQAADKEKYTKLIVHLNKVVDLDEYASTGMCFSKIVAKTFDMLPIIDEIECMPNCFVMTSLGQNTILNAIIGGEILKNAINGLFTKEVRFFRINRENCASK